MSFGFSVGDFLAVGQLAWQVYRKCKTAPSEFKSVSSQLVSLHIVIKDVHATIEEWELPEAKKDDLLQIVGDAKETLEELDQLLQKYKRLGLKSSRTFDRLRYPRAEVDELRIRVESSINMLTSFKTGLVLSSQARLEKMVSQLMSERQQGLREASIISHQSIAAAEDGDDDVWLDIKRELEDFGTVTDEFLNEQRGYIIDLLKSALAGDDESQSPITDSNVSGDQYAAGSHSPLQNSYEIVATMNDIALTEDKYLSELRSVKGADDDISGYLIDDLYNALSFYEMFCQGSTIGSNTLQMDLSLKLFHLGRGIRVIQNLSLANPEYWKKALTETIRAAEEALLLTEDIIELWLFNQNTNGLWEAGTTHLARLECPTSLTIVESDDPVVEKNILTLKDNFHVVRAAMEVDSGSLLLHRIMHQQIIACQFSLLVLQCESLWSYAQMVPYSKSKGGTLKYSYDINQEHLRKRSDMLIAQTNLLQATVSHHSRTDKNPHLLNLAFQTTWREFSTLDSGMYHGNSVTNFLHDLEYLYQRYYDKHVELGPQMTPSLHPIVLRDLSRRRFMVVSLRYFDILHDLRAIDIVKDLLCRYFPRRGDIFDVLYIALNPKATDYRKMALLILGMGGVSP